MKVFVSCTTECWSGGCVLVAANSEQEALKTAYHYDNYHFKVYNMNTFEYEMGYDLMSVFKEVEGLTFDTNEPKVIIHNIYFG